MNTAAQKLYESLGYTITQRLPKYYSNGGDAIGMESTVRNVWVDHVSLEASGGESEGYDGLFDLKDDVQYVTLSYSTLKNSGRGGLIGSSESDTGNSYITFHHNSYSNIDSRTPLLRGGIAHIYNNSYVSLNESGINSRAGARARIDNNYFKNSNNPLIASDDSPQPGCWQTRLNYLDSITYDRSVGDGALVVPVISGGQFDSTCTVTVPYSYTLENAANMNTVVPANAGFGKIAP